MSPINRANPEANSGGDTSWLPLPRRTWRMEVVGVKYSPARMVGEKEYRAQVEFALRVAEQDRPKLEKLGEKVAEGERISDGAWARYGATLNGYKEYGRVYSPTNLAQFVSNLFGTESQQPAYEWIKAGGTWPGCDSDDPDDVEAGLEWFVGCELYATIGHQDPKPDGKVWPKVSGTAPVGDREPDPAYEKWGNSRLRAVMAASESDELARPEDVQVTYDETGRKRFLSTKGRDSDEPAYDAKGEPVATGAAKVDDEYDQLFPNEKEGA